MTRGTWCKDRVAEAIRARQQQGLPLSTIWRENRSLYSAGGRLYGSWPEALQGRWHRTAVRQKWSKQTVLQELRSRYRRGVSRVRFWAANPELAYAAKRYFGGKEHALICAGLCQEKTQPPRRWSRQEVLAAIRTRHGQGLSLTTVWREDRGLYSSAKRLFGGWTGALRAAGIHSEPPPYPNRADVIDAIRCRHGNGLPMSGGDRAFPNLYAASRRHFESWGRAMAAAGIPPAPCRQWTRQTIIAAIAEHHRQGNLSRVWKDDKSLFSAACKRLGSWQNALEAAGLEPRRIRRWSKARIIDELRCWHGQSQYAVRLEEPSLVGAAFRFFGSLTSAAEAAGVELKRRKWTPQRVVDTIQDRYVQGLPIAIAGFGEVSLATIAKKRFGSWRDAVAAAGLGHKLPAPKVIRDWGKAAVLEAIVLRHHQGLRPTKVWEDDSGLYSAAKKYFGRWSNAILAAGLPPTRKQWSKQRVVEEIQAWSRRGVPISSISRQDARLTTAANRLFGTWHAALLAAGLRPANKPSSAASSSARRRKAG